MWVACTVPPLDGSPRQCPCASPWVCDESTQTCFVPRGEDAGVDSTPDVEVDVLLDTTEMPDDTSSDLALDVQDMTLDTADALGDAPSDQMVDSDLMSDADADAMEPPSYCDTSNAIICDGFDTTQNWRSTMLRDVDISVDTTRAYRGQSSLKVTVEAPSAKGSLFQRLAAPLSAQTIYMRAYVYLENTPYSNITWTNMRESTPPYHGNGVKIRDSGGALFFGAAPSPNQFSGGSVSKEEWTCWQAEILLSDAAGSGKLTLNGVDAITRTGLVNEPAGGVDTVSVGVDFASPTEMATFWIDEYVFDTSPIPCD